MSLHNVLALKASRSLVHLVHTDANWRQVFSGADVSLGYVRAATAWPVPDAVLVDGDGDDTASYCALEFKPPQSSKTECVRGLGQTLTYLAEYDCAALVLPDVADDGYNIARYMAGLISRPVTAQERIGIYAYPAAAATPALTGAFPLQLLKPIGGLAEQLTGTPRPRLERTFWAFWRDFSLHEIYVVLDHVDRASGDATARDVALSHAYAEYAALRTRDPQGRQRGTAGISEGHFKGNISTTISHLGLWHADGVLTLVGRRIVHLGRLFGPESSPFRDAFARQALLVGRHYELVKLVYEFQSNNPGQFQGAREFALALETFLEEEGLLKRLPGRRTTGSRRFFKAELTFWGVMLGIIRKRGRSYIVPGVGIDFDWPRILDILAGGEVAAINELGAR